MRNTSMVRTWRHFGVVMCVMCVQACSDAQPCYDEDGNEALCIDLGSPDMGVIDDMNRITDSGEQSDLDVTPDMPEDAGPPQDMEMDAATCEPLSREEVCDGVCGSQVDNCDQLVECDACVCDDSAVSQTRCGACGLGVLTCSDPANTNETQCSYPVTDIIDEATCDQIIYVDASAPGGNGSAEEPFTSYAAAIARFEAGASGTIVIAAGNYAEPLIIKDGVHVIGGYERLPEGWRRAADARIEFEPPMTDPAGPTFGLVARDVTTRTVVHGLVVKAADAPTEQTSYGAYLVDSSGIVLDSMTILAGKGGDGVAGMPGAVGADGEDGGAPECILTMFDNDEEPVPFGGQGGDNGSCAEANGGKGGKGAWNDQAGLRNAIKGEDSADGKFAGGDPGRSASAFDNEGEDGENAVLVSGSGEPGMGGSPEGRVFGEFWVSEGKGERGATGSHGSGGGGGGGAGGPSARPWMMGGGGGGSGGCGGEGGDGGAGGGASFGLFSVRSNATLSKSIVVADFGGRGGDGAEGGLGGAGGVGHPGVFLTCFNETVTWKSGNGGHGARGQQGGTGGGGAGGASYGAYCQDGTLGITSSELKAAQQSQGGAGGVQGVNGVVKTQFSCY